MDDEYDPYLHRENADTETWQAMVHYIKGCVGTGILAMPVAYTNAGIVTGTVSLIIITVLSTYCMQLLLRCKYKLCKRKQVPFLSYADSIKYALEEGPESFHCFADIAHKFVDFFLFAYLTGVGSCYIMFTAQNFKQIHDNYTEPENHMSVRIHILLWVVPLTLLNYIRNYRILAPFSLLANFLTILGLCIVIVYVFKDGLEDVNDRKLVVGIERFPAYLGIVIFALVSIGVIESLEQHMKKPRDWIKPIGVQNIGMTISGVLYMIVGLCGYLKYGDDSKGSVTLNLKEDEGLAQTAKIVYAIAIYISYALQMYLPQSLILEVYCVDRMRNNTEHPLRWEYTVRTLMCFFTVILAIAVPHLNLIINLIGVFCLSTLTFSFPAVLSICIYSPRYGPFKWRLIKDTILFIIGIATLILGTVVSVKDIADAIMNGE